MIEADFYSAQLYSSSNDYSAAEQHFTKAWNHAHDQHLLYGAIYAVPWVEAPLYRDMKVVQSRCVKLLIDAEVPLPPGMTLNPRKEYERIQGKLKEAEGKPKEAKNIYDSALRGGAESPADFGLLYARAKCCRQIANAKDALPADASTLLALANRDAEKAANVAFLRKEKVLALNLRSMILQRLITTNQGEKKELLLQQKSCLDKLIELAPRCPAAYKWQLELAKTISLYYNDPAPINDQQWTDRKRMVEASYNAWRLCPTDEKERLEPSVERPST